MRGDIITERHHGRWRNIIAGTYDTQAEAAEHGQATAEYLRVEWFLRARRGWFRLRNSYGNDRPDRAG